MMEFDKNIRSVALLLLMMLSVGGKLNAQQIGRYSMYMQNFYSVNPASAGLENHLDVTTGYRQQWIGLSHAPRTFFVSANMPLSKEVRSPAPASMRISDPNQYQSMFPPTRKLKHAVGAMANVSQYGAFKFTRAYATYAVHLPITKKLNLGFGTNVGFSSFNIDQRLIQLELPNDPFYDQSLIDAQQNNSLLDIDAGLMLYSRTFFVGYSTAQLLGNNVSFGSKMLYGELPIHHRLLFGYNIRVNRDWKLLPNGFVFLSKTGLMTAELNVRVDFRDQLWCGLSYRHFDAVIPMFGVYLNNQFKLGYAYDYTISNLRNYAPGGSHEIMIGWMFGNKRMVF